MAVNLISELHLHFKVLKLIELGSSEWCQIKMIKFWQSFHNGQNKVPWLH